MAVYTAFEWPAREEANGLHVRKQLYCSGSLKPGYHSPCNKRAEFFLGTDWTHLHTWVDGNRQFYKTGGVNLPTIACKDHALQYGTRCVCA